jgi:hypothetical protein
MQLQIGLTRQHLLQASCHNKMVKKRFTQMTKRSDYESFIADSYAREAHRLEGEIASWEKQASSDNPLLGYQAPKFPLQLASVAAFLYQKKDDAVLGRQAVEALLRYREFIRVYPVRAMKLRPEYADGVPPLDAVFDPLVFAAACERLKPILRPQEYTRLAAIAADSLKPVWRFPEWGGHNRAMLRAASLATCACTFYDHPDARSWLELADELAEESWGRWSIEDAMMYQAHWLRAMILYARCRQRSLASLIQPRMTIRAITQLLSPLGILPDFGDSHWLMHSHWEWMALLEWGACVYQDPEMKWAAHKIWQFKQNESPNLYAASALILAWEWCDDQVEVAVPHDTPDALDDLVMKKLVFRTGWEDPAAYACVNYRDEGDYARTARDYLRTNLAVSAEKMHHGHADEGSFSLLVHDSTVLLHESGYRENPPDGIYRADFYHNRLIWRSGSMLPGTKAWDYLQDNGHYKPVQSERLYQSRLCGIDIRRIRITDTIQGVSWDRSIFFIPEISCWVILDGVVALRAGPRTASLFWWTQQVLERSDRWFKTWIAGIQDWQNAQNSALWMYIPQIPGQAVDVSMEPHRRSFQEELLISATWSGHLRVNRAINFATILIPTAYHADSPIGLDQVSIFTSQPGGRGIGIKFNCAGEEYFLATLNDLECSYLQDDVRPRFTAEQGWCRVDMLESDAAFSVVRTRGGAGRIGFLNGTRLVYRGQEFFRMLPNAMFQEDRTHPIGITSRFRWEGSL